MSGRVRGSSLLLVVLVGLLPILGGCADGPEPGPEVRREEPPSLAERARADEESRFGAAFERVRSSAPSFAARVVGALTPVAEGATPPGWPAERRGRVVTLRVSGRAGKYSARVLVWAVPAPKNEPASLSAPAAPASAPAAPEVAEGVSSTAAAVTDPQVLPGAASSTAAVAPQDDEVAPRDLAVYAGVGLFHRWFVLGSSADPLAGPKVVEGLRASLGLESAPAPPPQPVPAAPAEPAQAPEPPTVPAPPAPVPAPEPSPQPVPAAPAEPPPAVEPAPEPVSPTHSAAPAESAPQ